MLALVTGFLIGISVFSMKGFSSVKSALVLLVCLITLPSSSRALFCSSSCLLRVSYRVSVDRHASVYDAQDVLARAVLLPGFGVGNGYAARFPRAELVGEGKASAL